MSLASPENDLERRVAAQVDSIYQSGWDDAIKSTDNLRALNAELLTKIDSFEADREFHRAQADRLKRQEDALRDQKALNAELLAALKPFAVEDKVSIRDTLGHINREHIANARAAIAKAKGES